jgi:hypothetical protein
LLLHAGPDHCPVSHVPWRSLPLAEVAEYPAADTS